VFEKRRHADYRWSSSRTGQIRRGDLSQQSRPLCESDKISKIFFLFHLEKKISLGDQTQRGEVIVVRIESNAKSNKTIIAKVLQKIKTAYEQEFKRFFDI
jgi:hypothetical protein